MNTEAAFAMGMATAGREPMVFDWDTAARLIKERQPYVACAGLRGDWEYTGGAIYRDGKTVNEYTYLASTWAIPELTIDGEVIPCYVMKHETKWDAKTKWPKSALKILKGDN